MALTVEDGTVVADAESYISVSAADTYWTKHGSPSAWSGGSVTTASKENALRMATQYLDAIYGGRWKGDRFDDEQVLDWPREGVEIDGVEVEETPLPRALTEACAELAYRHLTETGGLFPDVTDTGVITSQSVSAGPVSKSTTWQGGKGKHKEFSLVEKLLDRILLPKNRAVRS